ncbi:helix-turn-helix transcriptional regulator [Anaerotruncus sp. 1XD42-93]|uniref:helix-turn-helix domain-containing protein n=1 Tax=Anaerotruncus sp. 1XD42-93 TaxID=2320853 RepID=UPI000EA028DB|nr:helix-turn-helix transcriptional regulator [Anaerotruncus sp. 1XD42-93]NBK19685.1 XRE family transcriptional regulator [Anaerotruncus sp. 1XD42-93]RKJ78162.1 XRE family transcriptional regulator [Anaerotruncus sp. 1XD22-93]
MDQAYLPGTVRHRIQELIKERKITQAELAAEIGMAESSLSRFLSEKTDKIGDEYIIKIADFLGVSTDFILGQTDFPERRNYDIGELGLSYKAAMALYTREVDTDVVNRILESPQFPEITRMIARYFKDSNAEGPAGLNAMWDTMQQMIGTLDTSHLANPQEGTEAATQILGMMKVAPHERDVEVIQSSLMTMLRDIKAGIQTQTPTTELATKQITQSMMQSMVKGENAVPALQSISLEQLAGAYSTLPGTTPEMGGQFSELIKNFIRDFMDIAQKQGLTNERPDE